MVKDSLRKTTFLNGNVALLLTFMISLWFYGYSMITITCGLSIIVSFIVHIYMYRRMMFLIACETGNTFKMILSLIIFFFDGTVACGLWILFTFLTFKWRLLPNVIVLGEQKCGTTTLAYYLREILKWNGPYSCLNTPIATDKDSSYFRCLLNTYASPKYYSMCFPLKITQYLHSKTYFDASPSYLFLPFVRDRLLKLHQDNPLHPLKFIVIVRDPVDRAISNVKTELRYQRIIEQIGLKRNFGVDTLENMVEFCQTEQFKQNYNNLRDIKWNDKPPDYWPVIERFGMIQKGLYHESLIWYFEYEFFRKNTLILHLKQLSVSPADCIRKICKFMNIDETSVDLGSFTKVCLNRNESNDSLVTHDTKQMLQNIFKKDYVSEINKISPRSIS